MNNRYEEIIIRRMKNTGEDRETAETFVYEFLYKLNRGQVKLLRIGNITYCVELLN